jgi:uncharacterized OB-fold protein
MAYARAVISIYDQPMWESIRGRTWSLQSCDDCGEYRYPPAPICPNCLCMGYKWKPLSGTGKILSWVVFHKQYLPDYPPPYNVVAVQLAEGPIVISNLVGTEPEGSWLDRSVQVCYAPDAEGNLLPKMQLAESAA